MIRPCACLLTILLCLATQSIFAQASPDTKPEVTPTDDQAGSGLTIEQEITPELLEACQKGLSYLATQQNDDGSFGLGRYGRNVGIASICALAFMADGHMPGQDDYGQVVKKTLEYVLSCSTETGLIASANTSHGPMYGHGFATLFLGEVYGMNPTDTRVRDALVRAVQLIVNSQNEQGGWRYNPVPYDADVSVTICEVMGLRSARNAGIKVPKQTIDRAVRYVRDCQNPDGGFRYMIQPGGSAWPRTAAGVAALFYAGIYEDDSIKRGLEYLIRTAYPGNTNNTRNRFGRSHFYYGHYYAVQAMFIAGDEQWVKWWPAVRQLFLDVQNTNGSWTSPQTGSAYATAMSLIVLQMPKRYLPIFQK